MSAWLVARGNKTKAAFIPLQINVAQTYGYAINLCYIMVLHSIRQQQKPFL